mmetsp:Transcript_29786/g.50707  ORF Transcript_29786/g.50707 Transcript_29786/m.50707 type:complete len:97 (-) Transcript_29786:464-754(-)
MGFAFVIDFMPTHLSFSLSLYASSRKLYEGWSQQKCSSLPQPNIYFTIIVVCPVPYPFNDLPHFSSILKCLFILGGTTQLFKSRNHPSLVWNTLHA